MLVRQDRIERDLHGMGSRNGCRRSQARVRQPGRLRDRQHGICRLRMGKGLPGNSIAHAPSVPDCRDTDKRWRRWHSVDVEVVGEGWLVRADVGEKHRTGAISAIGVPVQVTVGRVVDQALGRRQGRLWPLPHFGRRCRQGNRLPRQQKSVVKEQQIVC